MVLISAISDLLLHHIHRPRKVAPSEIRGGTHMMNDEAWRRTLERRRRTVRDEVSADEWNARLDLAACYRLCVHYRMTDMIYNHISLRVPGRHDQFLIN